MDEKLEQEKQRHPVSATVAIILVLVLAGLDYLTVVCIILPNNQAVIDAGLAAGFLGTIVAILALLHLGIGYAIRVLTKAPLDEQIFTASETGTALLLDRLHQHWARFTPAQQAKAIMAIKNWAPEEGVSKLERRA